MYLPVVKTYGKKFPDFRWLRFIFSLHILPVFHHILIYIPRRTESCPAYSVQHFAFFPPHFFKGTLQKRAWDMRIFKTGKLPVRKHQHISEYHFSICRMKPFFPVSANHFSLWIMHIYKCRIVHKNAGKRIIDIILYQRCFYTIVSWKTISEKVFRFHFIYDEGIIIKIYKLFG